MKLNLHRAEVALKQAKYITDKLLKLTTKNRFYKKTIVEATMSSIELEDKIRFLKKELFRESHSEINETKTEGE